jgi:hypothetical protein
MEEIDPADGMVSITSRPTPSFPFPTGTHATTRSMRGHHTPCPFRRNQSSARRKKGATPLTRHLIRNLRIRLGVLHIDANDQRDIDDPLSNPISSPT